MVKSIASQYINELLKAQYPSKNQNILMGTMSLKDENFKSDQVNTGLFQGSQDTPQQLRLNKELNSQKNFLNLF